MKKRRIYFFNIPGCCFLWFSIVLYPFEWNYLNNCGKHLTYFFFFYGKFYWWVFTDKQLNCDTLIRLAYAHYLAAFYLAYIALLHGIDMHYDWKNEATYDGVETEMVWWDEALSNELGSTADILVLIMVVCWYWYPEPESLSYEIFMWGDIGLVPDVRFYGVAPHWYFRPFMAWLIACPHHKTGIFGLIFFFFVLFHQPTLHGISEQNGYLKRSLLFLKKKLNKISFYITSYTNQEINLYYQTFYGFFIGCAMYTTSFLPYGRFYNRLGGNFGMLGAYMFVYVYLSFYIFRRPYIVEFILFLIFSRANNLKNFFKKKSLSTNVV